MRLLERTHNGEFKLTKDLVGDKIPSYAILSHTWGPDTEEVTLKDLVDDTGKGKAGYDKIKFCAELAGRNDLQYFWVDTCCIDKSNNSELSEAINSMFRWYRNATRCYVYLSDVSTPSPPQNNVQAGLSWEPSFRASRWFTRGWTLQELLAPASVEFFTREGVRLGDKISLGQQIHVITGIPVPALQGMPLSRFEIDERLAWATTRQTTREEDWAYCLLGIFGIFMPLIYGEGRDHAISRLKKEISNAPKFPGMTDSSAIRDWLKAPDASVEYNSACKKRHPDTGLWLVEGQSFLSWLEDPNSFLWLNGFAGCGKSVLCSTAIQYAFRHQISSPRVGIAFFFFVFDDQSKQDTSAMLRALVLQLSSQLEDNHTLLSRLYDGYRNTKLPNEALADSLHQLIQMFDNVYILLDALDESPHDKYREGVLQALVDLRAWSEPGLHLLVTSRNETNIHDVLCNELGASGNEIISMKNKSVDCDIAAFTAQHLRDNRKLRKWKAYYDRIEEKFAERAKGVFRWVECQFKALEQCPQSKHLLDQLLDSLPESLDQTYERMLLNIAPICVEYSKSMLTLLCCAKRPLTVPELVDGIAVELGDSPNFNPSRRLETVDAIHEVCPGFIEVDEQPSGGAATVRIAHFSVQEYLESERILLHVAAQFSVRRREAHTNIARICLTYLLEPALLISIDLEREYPLALYAAKTWHEHLGEGDERINHVQHQTLRLFQNIAKFENWVGIWNVDDYYGRKPTEKLPSPVYYASLLGFDLLLSGLLEDNTVNDRFSGSSVARVSRLVNTQGGELGNALQAASARGYESVVRLLLKMNADVNAPGGYYGNALQAASAGGHDKIVQLLLLVGNADANAQGGEYGNSLYAASARDHEAIVRLLLDANADVNAQGGEYGNALYVASVRGHEAIVRLLLQRHADVNAGSGGYGSALYAASARGHEAIVRLLLDWDVDVNARGGEYGNALYAASARGHEAIVRLLLNRNADINAQGGFYGNALQAASAGGYEKVLHLLLERNADINATGSINREKGNRDEGCAAAAISPQVESVTMQFQLAGIGENLDKTRRNSFEGRAKKKDGRGTGAVGLTNLGNIGYMTSPLQCLRSVEELTKYFLTGEYTKDINEQNPLGCGGEMAIAYGNLINDIYHTSNDSIRPSDFRRIVGSLAPQFSGQSQQDSMEFLGCLLDYLQEDLNRVTRKPYIERPSSTDDIVHDEVAIANMADETWDIAIKRDDSVILDLFTGLYKSTLKCPVCHKISIDFSTFTNLTLPIPIKNPWIHTIMFFPLNDCPVEIEVEIPEGGTVIDMKQFISDRTGVPVERLIGAEQFKCKFYQIYNDDTDVSEILNNDILTIHELEVKPSNRLLKPVIRVKQQQTTQSKFGFETSKRKEHPPENARNDHIVVPVLHRRGNKQTRTFNDNGLPAHFITLNREEATSENAVRRKILEKVATFTTWDGFEDNDEDTTKINIAADAKASDSKVFTKSVECEHDVVDASINSAANNSPVVMGPDNSKSNVLKIFNSRRPRWVDTKEFLHPRLENMFDLGYFSDIDGCDPGYGESAKWHQKSDPSDLGMSTGRMIQDHQIFPRLSGRISDPILPIEQVGWGRDSWQNPNDSDNDSGGDEMPNSINAAQQTHMAEEEHESFPALNVVLQDRFAITMPDDGPNLVVRPGEGIVVDWTESAWDLLFGMDSTYNPNGGAKTYVNLPKLYDPVLEQQRISLRATDISVNDCLDEFQRVKILPPMDAWYCPRCKEHRRAFKKFDLWKTPDILICQFRRWGSSQSPKIDCKVDFPVEGLDLQQRV